MPVEVDADRVKAEYRDGILALYLPRAERDKPKSMDPLYTEYNIGHFARSFTLSNKIDQQQISAQLDDGVLTLTLKKAKEAMPRRIAISYLAIEKGTELGRGFGVLGIKRAASRLD